ncbi:MAG TPA: CsgG/HfaB family protein [Xanthomonadaceae bacterium]|nr:CsgG/HfaB family protein [Xanthomonadaceae bacterium]
MSQPSRLSTTLLGTLAIAALASPAARAASAQEQRAQQTAQIPTCSRNLGTLAVVEPESNWWSGAQLPSPAALIKVFVSRSHCFTLLDRGKGMKAMQAERELAGNGDLRGGSNLGKGQVKAADYVLVPDLVSQNDNSSGNNIGGLLGGLVGNRNVGALIGGINIKRKTADVVLTVTDVRSSEQVAMTEGHASKTDLGWGAGAGVFWGAFAGVGASGYADTEIGQVITLAYLQAYTDLVGQLGGLPANASAANVQQAVTMQKPGRLFSSPDGKGVVRPLDAGMLLYPTGNKQGVMWEVEDELGNKGWVSSLLFGLAR